MSESKFPSPFYRVAAKAIIRNKRGDILLVKERSDAWSIPGGGLEHGEDLRAAVQREVQEELGATAQSVSPRPVFVFSALNKQFNVWCFTVCYEVTLDEEQELTLGDGSTDAKYFDPSEIKRDLVLEDADAPLVDCL